ncbi:murein biosynthesis integral membrane protein MurJ [Helicobacter mustelae]|uniref:Probable lipid II flippase MurJ n=1 Tax=Helicobacter mustelae (strain ATCC 43772 / CCUG 25715 / CIP 103759 / LMG 18044 / NCTC 12198 / R85-136P) TaxID=679897 RepID=D3UGR3_HELM1|nr:murein biosynthesis integral membrane protein MurJ [Helicobacter mustelae]CBG39684.1 integral membrane protein (MviN homolog) [Helicobacter mustelae 12198]SQH71190.1 integral membrane protein MviN [Helicobacter mustelae]
MLKKAFFTNSSGIFFSRIFGFLRDLLMANILGAGMFSDIFFAAFKFPNLFRRIFGEGAFVQSFLPSLISSKRKGMFIVSTFFIFLFSVLLLSLCVYFFAPFFTKLLAYGFSREQLALTEPIVVINFWYLGLVFVSTFFSTLLQYKNIFWVNAYNTVLLNVFMILSLFLARDLEKMQIVYFLSYGVLCGGVAQILLHFYPLYQARYFRLFILGCKDLLALFQGRLKAYKKAEFFSSTKGFFKQFFPALFGSSTAQIAAFLDTILASFLATGSISYLYYANRIFQLPLAIFAIAISTALFPTIARAIKNLEEHKARDLMKKAFWVLLILLSLCVCGGIVLKNEVIYVLFERGKFLRQDTLIAANVFALYLLGLVPFGLAKVFALWLFAHKKQGVVALCSGISLLVGLLCSLILMQYIGVYGLALASSISGLVLFSFTVRGFGFAHFLIILRNKKGFLLLFLLLGFEFLLLEGGQMLMRDLGFFII